MSLLINRATPEEPPLTAHCDSFGQMTMCYLSPPPVIYVRPIDIAAVLLEENEVYYSNL